MGLRLSRRTLRPVAGKKIATSNGTKSEVGLGLLASPPPTPTALVAAAGEHYVLHRLFRHGLLAALAPRNEPNFDVIVFGKKNAVAATIQVKARTRGADGGWMMRRKHEQLVEDGLFYAFVDLEIPDAVVTYVLPSAIVARTLKRTHEDWLKAPGKGGQVHNDSDMRRIRPAYEWSSAAFQKGWLDYWKERWDLLENYKPRSARKP
jgi:hypothetical protein